MHKKLLLVFFIFLSLQSFRAGAQDKSVTIETEDSTVIINNSDDDDYVDEENTSGFAKDVIGDTLIYYNGYEISKDSINSWKNQKEYKWIKNIDSFLINKKKVSEKQPKITVKENSGPSFLSSIFISGILQTLLWIAAVGFLLFIIYKLFLSNAFFAKRSKKSAFEIKQDEDEVKMSNDYDSLLRRAYTAGELRLAMRYLFLKTLQKLNDREMIRFSVDKTNSMYVKEIAPAKRNLFASLALYYEYIWYGNATVNKQTFDAIEIKFNEFLNRL